MLLRHRCWGIHVQRQGTVKLYSAEYTLKVRLLCTHIPNHLAEWCIAVRISTVCAHTPLYGAHSNGDTNLPHLDTAGQAEYKEDYLRVVSENHARSSAAMALSAY
jgi:hypothetical protein